MPLRSNRRASHLRDDEEEYIDLTSEVSEDDLDKYSNGHQLLNVIAANPIADDHVEVLKFGQWLNDEIINAYLFTLQSENKPGVVALSSFFYKKLCQEGLNDQVKRWLGPIGDINDRSLILIPINLNNSHWAMATYVVAAKTLNFYDSMLHNPSGMRILGKLKPVFEYLHETSKKGKTIEKTPSPPPTSTAKMASVKDTVFGLTAYLQSKLNIKEDMPVQSTTEIKLVIPSGQPQQTDGSSCGVFVCKWAQKLATKSDTKFSQSDIAQHRRHMVDKLCTFEGTDNY